MHKNFLMTGLKQFYKVNYSYGYEFGNHILNLPVDILDENIQTVMP